jgi:hypothetical protein
MRGLRTLTFPWRRCYLRVARFFVGVQGDEILTGPPGQGSFLSKLPIFRKFARTWRFRAV